MGHSRLMNCHPDINYEELARSTRDFNGAMLKAVCVEAGMIALRNENTQLTHQDFVEAIAEVQAKKQKGKSLCDSLVFANIFLFFQRSQLFYVKLLHYTIKKKNMSHPPFLFKQFSPIRLPDLTFGALQSPLELFLLLRCFLKNQIHLLFCSIQTALQNYPSYVLLEASTTRDPPFQ